MSIVADARATLELVPILADPSAEVESFDFLENTCSARNNRDATQLGGCALVAGEHQHLKGTLPPSAEDSPRDISADEMRLSLSPQALQILPLARLMFPRSVGFRL